MASFNIFETGLSPEQVLLASIQLYNCIIIVFMNLERCTRYSYINIEYIYLINIWDFIDDKFNYSESILGSLS